MKHCIILSLASIILITNYLAAQSWQWVRSFGGAQTDFVSAIAVDSADALYAFGQFENSIQIGNNTLSSKGLSDLVVAKLTTTGQPLWARSFGGYYADQSTAMALSPNNQTIVIGGLFYDSLQMGGDWLCAEKGITAMFWAKISENGEVLSAEVLQGTGYHALSDLTIGSDGSVFVTGFFKDTLLLGKDTLVAKGAIDAFVAKWDTSGQLLWSRRWGLTANTRGVQVAADANGNVALGLLHDGQVQVGQVVFESPTNDDDLLALKLDTSGRLLWANQFWGNDSDGWGDLAMDAKGNVYTSAWFSNVIYIQNVAYQTIGFDADWLLMRLRAGDGYPEWVRTAGGLGYEYVAAMALRDDRIAVTGYTIGKAAIGSLTFDSNDFEAVLTTFDTSGNWVNGWRLGGNAPDYGKSVALGANGLVALGLNFVGATDLNNTNISSMGGADMAILYGNTTLLSTQHRLDESTTSCMTFAPNPITNDWMTIQLVEKITAPAQFFVFNHLGQIVLEKQLTEPVVRVSLEQLPAGFYYCKLKSDNQNKSNTCSIARFQLVR